LNALASTIRVSDALYESLREIKLLLEQEHKSAAPSLQDCVTVALERFVREWKSEETRDELIGELLLSRKQARSKMGNTKK
jgi:hypothetical protein